MRSSAAWQKCGHFHALFTPPISEPSTNSPGNALQPAAMLGRLFFAAQKRARGESKTGASSPSSGAERLGSGFGLLGRQREGAVSKRRRTSDSDALDAAPPPPDCQASCCVVPGDRVGLAGPARG